MKKLSKIYRLSILLVFTVLLGSCLAMLIQKGEYSAVEQITHVLNLGGPFLILAGLGLAASHIKFKSSTDNLYYRSIMRILLGSTIIALIILLARNLHVDGNITSFSMYVLVSVGLVRWLFKP